MRQLPTLRINFINTNHTPMKKLITLYTLFIVFTARASAQIPNPSFELWSSFSSYTVPDSWDNLNAITSASAGISTCEKGATSPPHGAAFLQLTTKLIAAVVTPGIAVCGKIDIATKTPKSGFPFSKKTTSLTGKLKYNNSAATDTGYIAVWLTKWNTTSSKRDTVATKIHKLTAAVSSWTAFDVVLTYMSGIFPDSAIIGLSASGLMPAAGSYLHVDSVNFTGTVAGVPSTTYTRYDVKMYPNPASGNVSIDFGTTLNEDVRILVMDVFGRVKTNAVYDGGRQVYDTDVSKLAAGIYYVMVRAGEDIQTQKLVIQ